MIITSPEFVKAVLNEQRFPTVDFGVRIGTAVEEFLHDVCVLLNDARNQAPAVRDERRIGARREKHLDDAEPVVGLVDEQDRCKCEPSHL